MRSSTLPSEMLVTPDPPTGEACGAFVAHLERALASGILLVQLRAKTVASAQYLNLAALALASCRRQGARLLLNAPPEMVIETKADGVHLTSSRLMACTDRPLPKEFIVSAACHDAAQVEHANRIGADILTISPVLPTATHTTAAPLGWMRFRELVMLTDIPVYALGGMTHETLPTAHEAGAVGIAAIRALWRAGDS